jgi:hypothetical protein
MSGSRAIYLARNMESVSNIRLCGGTFYISEELL